MNGHYRTHWDLPHCNLASVLLASLSFTFAEPLVAQNGTWDTRTPMPTGREKVAACVIGQDIYVLGGALGENQPGLQTNQRYAVHSDTWTDASPMPTGRRSLTASVVEDVCYAIGGRANFGQPGFNTVEALNPASSWTARADMPTARFAAASAVIGGKIYVAGGSPDGITVTNAFEEYDPVSNSWASLPSMPTARAFLAAAALGGKFYAIGGTSNPAAVDFNLVEVYDPAANTWSPAAPMPTARTGLAALAVADRIYAIGGSVGAAAVNTVEYYDAASDSWAAGPPLNVGRTKLSGAAVDGLIFAIGGALRLAPPHPGLDNVEALVVSGAELFQINAGLNDAWFNPVTSGQGFFITVFPDIQQIFLAWFTYDTERPPDDVQAILGEPGHRWLTAFGPYADEMAMLDIELTHGGVFDMAKPISAQEPDGAITLEFSDCESGLVSYDIDSVNLQGEIPIQRIALDNVPACEALTAE